MGDHPRVTHSKTAKNPRAPSLLHRKCSERQAPEIPEPSPCVAASGNESSRISAVRTSEPRIYTRSVSSFASVAEPPSFPRSLVRREQPQVDVNGHTPQSKSARSDSLRMGEQGTHLLLLEDRLRKHTRKTVHTWCQQRDPAWKREEAMRQILEPRPSFTT